MSITIEQLKDFLNQYPDDWNIRDLSIPNGCETGILTPWGRELTQEPAIVISFVRPVKGDFKV